MGLYVRVRIGWITDSSDQIAGGEGEDNAEMPFAWGAQGKQRARRFAEKRQKRGNTYEWLPRGICRTSGACVFSLAEFPALARWAKFCRASGAAPREEKTTGRNKPAEFRAGGMTEKSQRNPRGRRSGGGLA